MFVNPNFPQNEEADKNAAAELPRRKVNIDQYSDPISGLSGRGLKFSLWLARHRMTLRRVGITILIMVSAATWLYSIGWLIYALAYGNTAAQQVEAGLTAPNNYAAINSHFAPAALQINSSAILPGGTNKSDAVAMVANPNAKYSALIDYYFVINGTSTPMAHAILLPLQTQPLVYLGYDGAAGGANMVIQKINWRRVDAHQIINVEAWMNDRLNLAVENYQILGPAALGGVGATIVKFDLVNNSTFGFKYPRFLVGLYQGGGLVGLLPLELDQLPAQSTRAIDLRSFVNLPADGIKLFPLFDLFDSAIYLPPPS